MTHITLFVTGDMEKAALADSLLRVFPDASFDVKQIQGITSNTLSARTLDLWLQNPQSILRQAASLLTAEVDPGRNKNKDADFAVLVDDLELANQHQPDLVRDALRRAIPLALEGQWPTQQRRDQATRRVNQRCSFHLMAPMTETYFFHCDAALGALAPLRPLTPEVRATDPEDFEITSDQGFLQPPSRARHPKRYTEWLLTSTDGSAAPAYKEKTQGSAALKALQWGRALQNDAWARFARALFEDIADMLGVPAPFPGQTHTALHQRGFVIRNL